MMTGRKLSLFISSTMDEHALERNAARNALEGYEMHGWLFEKDAGARPYSIQRTYYKEVEACDIYIGLFWLDYGTFTIDEYNKARELNKPCLVYIKRIDEEKRDAHLAAFLQSIQNVTDPQGLTVASFNTIDELTMQLRQDVMHLLVTKFREGRQQPHLPIDTRDRLKLLTKIRDFWINNLLKHSLYRDAFIVLGLRQQPDAVENPWHLVLQESVLPVQELQPGTRIIEVYDNALGELLILGEPGSGKTTLLLELTRDLLERAERDRYHRIPFVFNLSSWAIKRQSLDIWLEEEVKTRYRASPLLARALMDNDLILPLLDGLDEVAVPYRKECVECINVYRSNHDASPLVVCSRSAEYLALTDTHYVQLHTAVTVLPLTAIEIDKYLSRVEEDLKAVAQALREDTMLQEIATTPLMLNILIVTYAGKSVQDLVMEGTLEARRYKIFDTYIERMLHRRNLVSDYPEQPTMQRLSWLAWQMNRHDRTAFYLEELQGDWLSAPWARLAYHTLTGLIFGMVAFLAFGAFIGLFIDPGFALVAGLVLGIVIGVVFGLLIGLRGGPASAIQPTEGIAWSFERFRQNFFPRLRRGLRERLPGALGFGLFVGLIGGVIIGLRIGYIIGLKVGFIGGLSIGIIVWLIAMLSENPDASAQTFGGIKGILEGFRQSWLFLLSGGLIAGVRAGLIAGLSNKPLNVEQRSTPNQGIWRSARYAAIFALIFALVFGPLFGLVGGLTLGSKQVLHFALSGVISSALLSALIFGGEACTKHFVLRLLLCLDGNVPWNYSQFLDYAAQRILLRKVGGSYIFIHRLLLEHFVAHREV